jgi:hypothetical protein
MENVSEVVSAEQGPEVREYVKISQEKGCPWMDDMVSGSQAGMTWLIQSVDRGLAEWLKQ